MANSGGCRPKQQPGSNCPSSGPLMQLPYGFPFGSMPAANPFQCTNNPFMEMMSEMIGHGIGDRSTSGCNHHNSQGNPRCQASGGPLQCVRDAHQHGEHSTTRPMSQQAQADVPNSQGGTGPMNAHGNPFEFVQNFLSANGLNVPNQDQFSQTPAGNPFEFIQNFLAAYGQNVPNCQQTGQCEHPSQPGQQGGQQTMDDSFAKMLDFLAPFIEQASAYQCAQDVCSKPEATGSQSPKSQQSSQKRKPDQDKDEREKTEAAQGPAPQAKMNGDDKKESPGAEPAPEDPNKTSQNRQKGKSEQAKGTSCPPDVPFDFYRDVFQPYVQGLPCHAPDSATHSPRRHQVDPSTSKPVGQQTQAGVRNNLGGACPISANGNPFEFMQHFLSAYAPNFQHMGMPNSFGGNHPLAPMGNPFELIQNFLAAYGQSVPDFQQMGQAEQPQPDQGRQDDAFDTMLDLLAPYIEQAAAFHCAHGGGARTGSTSHKSQRPVQSKVSNQDKKEEKCEDAQQDRTSQDKTRSKGQEKRKEARKEPASRVHHAPKQHNGHAQTEQASGNSQRVPTDFFQHLFQPYMHEMMARSQQAHAKNPRTPSKTSKKEEDPKPSEKKPQRSQESKKPASNAKGGNQGNQRHRFVRVPTLFGPVLVKVHERPEAAKHKPNQEPKSCNGKNKVEDTGKRSQTGEKMPNKADAEMIAVSKDKGEVINNSVEDCQTQKAKKVTHEPDPSSIQQSQDQTCQPEKQQSQSFNSADHRSIGDDVTHSDPQQKDQSKVQEADGDEQKNEVDEMNDFVILPDSDETGSVQDSEFEKVEKQEPEKEDANEDTSTSHESYLVALPEDGHSSDILEEELNHHKNNADDQRPVSNSIFENVEPTQSSLKDEDNSTDDSQFQDKDENVSDSRNVPNLLQEQVNSTEKFDERSGSEMKLWSASFDVREYTAQDVQVQTTGRRLIVKAAHTEETEDGPVSQQFQKTVTVPKDVDPETITCSMDDDTGFLIAKAIRSSAVSD